MTIHLRISTYKITRPRLNKQERFPQSPSYTRSVADMRAQSNSCEKSGSEFTVKCSKPGHTGSLSALGESIAKSSTISEAASTALKTSRWPPAPFLSTYFVPVRRWPPLASTSVSHERGDEFTNSTSALRHHFARIRNRWPMFS